MHSHSAGRPHVDRKLYVKIFLALAVLTAVEVGVVYIPGIGKFAMGSALTGLAVVKAAMVGWFFMHVGHETKPLRWTIVLPFIFPVLYAVVLIADATVRLALAPS